MSVNGQHDRQNGHEKRDIGEIAWAIPAINDVQNTITIAPRRRSRGAQARDTEAAPVAGRKPA